MISSKAIEAIFLGATLCTAQSINISGTVQDSAGAGIAGATVKLEIAGISTTTVEGGIFTLTNDPTHIRQRAERRTTAASSIWLQNGMITVNLSEKTSVGISVHDVSGRQLYKIKQTYDIGTHALHAPLQSAGVYLYTVTLGTGSYTFKFSPLGGFSTERNVDAGGRSALTRQAKATESIADVISVMKEGQLDYRDSMKTSDTSGIAIKMIPNAGNVTDADGNVYQSVRIDSQVWTVENLRTTRYNDGTAIPHVTDASSWSGLSTPGYCFYNNVTHADTIKKWGAMYNWYAVSPTNSRQIAPAGWHAPSQAEYETLINYLVANGYNWNGSRTGNKVAKSIAARTDWEKDTSTGAIGCNMSINNATGFSALPGGYRGRDGDFFYRNLYGYLWTATAEEIPDWGALGYAYKLGCSREHLSGYGDYAAYGFSVRLVRDK